MCSSTPMRMAAPGMRRLVHGQLRGVILMCSSMRMRMAALGMRGLVQEQPGRVILMCSSTRVRMAVPGMRRLGIGQQNQYESGCRRMVVPSIMTSLMITVTITVMMSSTIEYLIVIEFSFFLTRRPCFSDSPIS